MNVLKPYLQTTIAMLIAAGTVLCGAGHNLRMILRKLRFFCVLVFLAFFVPVDQTASVV